MSDIRRLSEVVYVGLCHKIGTCEEVSVRRETGDLRNVIWNNKSGLFKRDMMLSGSHREGFRLSGSDQDFMYWPRDHKVICDLSQAQHYQQPETTVFLMECVESRPGFVLLQLLTPSHNREVRSSCVKVNDVFYISSTIYRKQIVRDLLGKGYKEHGPCRNIVLSRCNYNLEIDEAYCLSCDYWPPQAASWIQRCSLWPSPAVVYEIIVSGCHFMAIGSKESPTEFLEWRLSFSQAEQKLVYAMNHCQFLVYGLLKLFLKEVINQGDHEILLCSYFMKTAVFWEIQDKRLSIWCPQNIVICFWSCFKRILKWVYHGYCPNFFVAENNMFCTRIWGLVQKTLFLQLFELYQKGMSCLLYCKSIRSYLYEIFYNPTNVINLHEKNRSSKFSYALTIFSETYSDASVFVSSDLCRSIRHLKELEYLSKTNLTKCQGLQLHLQATEYLTATAFCVHQTHIGGNRTMYSGEKLLQIVARSGFIADILYLVILYYKTCRYTEALALLKFIEVQFFKQRLTYNSNSSVEKHIVDVGGCFLLFYLKQHKFWDFILYNDLCNINQLALEQRISKAKKTSCLKVPPLVLLRMLYVLCYNHVNKERRQEALNNLYILVHHDPDMYIRDQYRDISYQILGICQEIYGDFFSAIQSYNVSLKCQPLNNITEASLIRIKHALTHLESTS